MNNRRQISNNSRWQQYHHWLYALVLPVYLALFFLSEHLIGADANYTVIYFDFDGCSAKSKASSSRLSTK